MAEQFSRYVHRLQRLVLTFYLSINFLTFLILMSVVNFQTNFSCIQLLLEL